MRGICRFLLSAMVCTAISPAWCAPARAGIAVVNQSRDVFTQGPEINQTDTATPFAPFNDTISKSGSFTGNQNVTSSYSASASQHSTVDLGATSLHISANGSVSFMIDGDALTQLGEQGKVGSGSEYSVSFSLTTPATYKIVESTSDQTMTSLSGLTAQAQGARLVIPNGAHPSTVFDVIPFPLMNQPSSAPVTFTGTLMPGTYIFSGSALGNAAASASESASFSADLAVSTTGAEAVPLPPALWMAMLTMVVVLPAIYMLRGRGNADRSRIDKIR